MDRRMRRCEDIAQRIAGMIDEEFTKGCWATVDRRDDVPEVILTINREEEFGPARQIQIRIDGCLAIIEGWPIYPQLLKLQISAVLADGQPDRWELTIKRNRIGLYPRDAPFAWEQ